ITPARVGFLLLLVGTTVELLTERWREAQRRDRWRRRVHDHYIITGYGVKGRSAARALCEDGVAPEDVVVVELRRDAADEASAEGYTVIVGDASRAQVLREARAERARAVIIAPSRDDTAVLTTLTARELAPEATIIAAVREEENAHLLRRSGADEAIVSAETSGRLLGLTSRNPRVGQIVSDLLHTDYGLALVEHEVSAEQAGSSVVDLTGQRTIAVVRDGRMLRYDDPEIGDLREGDRVVGFPSGDEDGEGSGGRPRGTGGRD
ncbi:MAG: potassium channel family protein, partial [Actinomycetota bacterium]